MIALRPLSLRIRLILMFWGLTIIPLIVLTIAVFLLLNTSINVGVSQHLERGLNAAIAIADQSYQEYLNRISFKTVDISYAPELKSRRTWYLADSLFQREVTSLEVDGLELYDLEGNLVSFVTKPSYEDRIQLTDQKQILDGLASNFDLLMRVGKDRQLLKTGKAIEDYQGRVIGMLIGNKIFPEDYVNNLNTLENNTRFYAEVDLLRGRYFRALFGAFATLAFAVMIIAVFSAIFLSRRFTQPIAQLVAATHELAQGNMDYRLRQNRHDEIGELIASFNTMARDLAENRQKLINAERIAAWQGIARRLAHEIKNPLTPIQLAIQHLRDEYSQPHENFNETFNDCTDTIIQEVDGLRRMVQEFSEFARLPAPDFQSTDINSLINDLVSFYATGHPQVTFALGLDRELPLIDADPEKIRQVLINLVENSLDSLSKQPEKRIKVNTQMVSEQIIRVEISDTGCGIPENELEFIFQPYFTTKENGTGLGLAIVDRIIQDHHGKIQVSSQLNRGSTIDLTLPITQNTQKIYPSQ